jgi:hypothetical protein
MSLPRRAFVTDGHSPGRCEARDIRLIVIGNLVVEAAESSHAELDDLCAQTHGHRRVMQASGGSPEPSCWRPGRFPGLVAVCRAH